MESILLITLLWLYVGAFAIYPIGKYLRHKTGYLAGLIIGISLLLYLNLYNKAVDGYMESYQWVNIEGITRFPSFLKISFDLRLDGVNYAIGLIILIVTFAAVIYSVEYMKHSEWVHAYYMLYIMYVGGMLGTIMSMDLIQFLFFWEAMLIPSYILIAVWGYGEKRRVAFKYFLYTQLGTILLIISFALLGFYAGGSFSFYSIYNVASLIPDSVRLLLIVMMIIGFGVKMAIVPLHGWLPEAHAEAPTPISVILSGVMIEIGLYALIRIVLPVTYPQWTLSDSTSILMILALISMYYGGAMALAQNDVKRLLAYSSISQMGYMFLGVAAASAVGIEGSILHIVGHGLMKGLLFMIAGVLIHEVGIRDMRMLGGLAIKMPITASLAVIGAMGIAGLPGILTFVSEFLIFSGGISSNSPYSTFIIVLAVLATGLSAGYMTLFVKRVFFGPLREELNDAKDPSLSMIIPMLLLALLGIIIGVYPRILIDVILPGITYLLSQFGVM
jgi:NADH-quinone oxidoreductase subunit M